MHVDFLQMREMEIIKTKFSLYSFLDKYSVVHVTLFPSFPIILWHIEWFSFHHQDDFGLKVIWFIN